MVTAIGILRFAVLGPHQWRGSRDKTEDEDHIQYEVGSVRTRLFSVAKPATRNEQRTTLDALWSRYETWKAVHREDRDYT